MTRQTAFLTSPLLCPAALKTELPYKAKQLLGARKLKSTAEQDLPLDTFSYRTAVRDVRFGAGQRRFTRLAKTLGVLLMMLVGGTAYCESAHINPARTLWHYVQGEGEPMSVDISRLNVHQLETSEQFPPLATIAKARYAAQNFKQEELTLPFGYYFDLPQADFWSLGGIALQLKGKIRVHPDGTWTFTGHIEKLTDDEYNWDFTPEHQRSLLANIATSAGAFIPSGQAFAIVMENQLPYTKKGKLLSDE